MDKEYGKVEQDVRASDFIKEKEERKQSELDRFVWANHLLLMRKFFVGITLYKSKEVGDMSESLDLLGLP